MHKNKMHKSSANWQPPSGQLHALMAAATMPLDLLILNHNFKIDHYSNSLLNRLLILPILLLFLALFRNNLLQFLTRLNHAEIKKILTVLAVTLGTIVAIAVLIELKQKLLAAASPLIAIVICAILVAGLIDSLTKINKQLQIQINLKNSSAALLPIFQTVFIAGVYSTRLISAYSAYTCSISSSHLPQYLHYIAMLLCLIVIILISDE